MIKLIAVVATITLAGCATGPKQSQLTASQTAAGEGKSQLVIYRTGLLGAAVQPAVRVNGRNTGKCTPKGVFYVDVLPGQNTIAATTEVETTLNVDVLPGKITYVRCRIGIGILIGRPKFNVVSPSTGRMAIKSLSFTGKY